MSYAIEVLDFDTLARKYFAMSPSCRGAQFVCSILAIFFLMIAFVILAVPASDMILFGLSHIDRLLVGAKELPVLDFHISMRVLHELVYGEALRTDRELLSSPWLALTWILCIFVALSFVSLRLDLFAFAAIACGIGWKLYVSSITFASEFRYWQTVPDALGAQLTTVVDAFWSGAVAMYFLFVGGVTLRTYFTLSPRERDILREGASDVRFAGSTFLHAFGIPPNIVNSSRKIRTMLFAYMATLIGAGPVFLFLLVGSIASQVFWAHVGPYVTGWYDPARMPAAEVGFTFVLYNLVHPLLLMLFWFLFIVSFVYVGNRCLNVSRRFLRVSLERAQAADPRPPVLFLRSFRNDPLPLPAPKSTFAYKLFHYAERNKSLDHLLLEEGTALGPVVALGDPTDAVPPYGAARGYAGQRDWRRMVADLMQAAAAIVICIDDTDNLWWEVEQVSANGFLSKSLLLLHPKYEGSDQQKAGVVAKIERLCGRPLTKSLSVRPRPDLLGLWFDETAGLHIGWTPRLSRVHYLLMLRWFLRAKARRAIDDAVALKGEMKAG